MTTKPDQELGLYRKYDVSRVDGSSGQGEKHEFCKTFVLDPAHDKFARVALLVYMQACKDEYPQLAADIDKWLFPELTAHEME